MFDGDRLAAEVLLPQASVGERADNQLLAASPARVSLSQ